MFDLTNQPFDLDIKPLILNCVAHHLQTPFGFCSLATTCTDTSTNPPLMLTAAFAVALPLHAPPHLPELTPRRPCNTNRNRNTNRASTIRNVQTLPSSSSANGVDSLNADPPTPNKIAHDTTSHILRDIDILKVTDQWVAVNKPPGVLMHRTQMYKSLRGEQYLIESVRRSLSAQLGRKLTLFPVQRLDRATSGVVLFGLDEPRNAAMLQEALQTSPVAPPSTTAADSTASADESAVEADADAEGKTGRREPACKQYWVMAFHASQMPADGSWVNNHPLKDLPTATGRRTKNRIQRSASTHFETLMSFDDPADIAVLTATLATGRRHQIRRHLSNARFPVVGDTSHGDTLLNHEAKAAYDVPRLCLHARRISFTDPFSKERVYLQVRVPEDLRQVVRQLPNYTPDLDGKLDFDDPPDFDPSVFHHHSSFDSITDSPVPPEQDD